MIKKDAMLKDVKLKVVVLKKAIPLGIKENIFGLKQKDLREVK